VVWRGDDKVWRKVEAAAKQVAVTLKLSETWLNKECTNYANCLPLGWQGRCEAVGEFGPLHVRRISRMDLIAAKVVSCPRRPQDVEDLQEMKPTESEWRHAEENLDRLQSEDLDGNEYEDQREVLKELRGGS
jgi:hypothetical protein